MNHALERSTPMTKKIVFIHGSPRKNGNTRALAGVTMAALAAMGVESGEIDAARLDFKHPGCIACYKCQSSEAYGCHIDDGLAKAVATLPDYDAIVLATPIYWFSHTAQAKMLIDRMFSLIKFGPNHEFHSPLAGKPLALLATGGGPVEDNLEVLEKAWSIPARHVGSPYLSCLFPMCPPMPGEVIGDPAAVAKAEDFAKKLVELLGA